MRYTGTLHISVFLPTVPNIKMKISCLFSWLSEHNKMKNSGTFCTPFHPPATKGIQEQVKFPWLKHHDKQPYFFHFRECDYSRGLFGTSSHVSFGQRGNEEAWNVWVLATLFMAPLTRVTRMRKRRRRGGKRCLRDGGREGGTIPLFSLFYWPFVQQRGEEGGGVGTRVCAS